MPREPESDEEIIQRFIKPVGVLLTERAAVLATIYAAVMAGGQGYEDHRVALARSTVVDFLRLLDGT